MPDAQKELRKLATKILYPHIDDGNSHTIRMTRVEDAMHLIEAHTAQKVTEALEQLLAKQFWAADDAYDAGDVVSVDDIKAALTHLTRPEPQTAEPKS